MSAYNGLGENRKNKPENHVKRTQNRVNFGRGKRGTRGCCNMPEESRENDEKIVEKLGGKPAAPIAGKTGRRLSKLAGMGAGTSGPTGDAGRNRVAVPETPGNGRKTANTPAKRAGNAGIVTGSGQGKTTSFSTFRGSFSEF